MTKLSGRRRKPYIARWTVGYDDNGKQIRKTIGTFSSRDEAENALFVYRTNPYDLSETKKTFEDVYNVWSAYKFPDLSEATSHNYKNAYRKSSFLWKKPFREISLDDLIYTIESSGSNYPSIKIMKSLYCSLYKYAMPRHLCSEDYSRYLDISKYQNENPNSQKREKITNDELKSIWDNSNSDIAKIVLMLCYSGMRIGELLNLKKCDCHIDDRYIDIVTSKTDAGIRKVPIAEKTVDFWKHFLNTESEYLIYTNGRDFHGNTSRDHAYKRFLDSYWSPYMESLSIYKTSKPDVTKTPHECRYACVSMLESAGIPDVKIKRIVGHASHNVTHDTYTQLDVSDLIEAINKI